MSAGLHHYLLILFFFFLTILDVTFTETSKKKKKMVVGMNLSHGNWASFLYGGDATRIYTKSNYIVNDLR